MGQLLFTVYYLQVDTHTRFNVASQRESIALLIKSAYPLYDSAFMNRRINVARLTFIFLRDNKFVENNTDILIPLEIIL